MEINFFQINLARFTVCFDCTVYTVRHEKNAKLIIYEKFWGTGDSYIHILK